jgi:hypothetical protein
VWRAVRAFPPAPDADGLRRSYPRALLDQVGLEALLELNRLRRSYRLGANLFAAALVACAGGNQTQFDDLRQLMWAQARAEPDTVGSFSQAAEGILGRPAPDYLDAMTRSGWEAAAGQVAKLEREVGLNLYGFTEEFADAVAYVTFAKDSMDSSKDGSEDRGWGLGRRGATVYPVSTVIQQEAASLVTSATATTVVEGDFGTLCRAVDRRCWCLCSDVIKRTKVVVGPFDLDRCRPATCRPSAGVGASSRGSSRSTPRSPGASTPTARAPSTTSWWSCSRSGRNPSR